MSVPYLESTDNTNMKHFKHKYIASFTGNFYFASANSCKGYNKSRRDDIESALYLLLFLLNNNRLPWSELYRSKAMTFERRV
jgi:hypothetical protein